MNEFAIAQCVIGLTLIAFVYFHLISSLRREEFRSKLRTIRDGLFDFMWQNGFDFTDPDYQDTRQTLNGLLRFSNTMGAMEFLMVLMRTEIDPDQSDFRDTVPDRLKSEILRVRKEAISEWLKFLFNRWEFRLLRFLVNAIASLFRLRKTFPERCASFVKGMAFRFGEPQLTMSQKAVLHR